jgi:hypothetical protein
MTAAASYLTQLLSELGPAPSPQDVVNALVPEIADLVQVFLARGGIIELVAYRHIDPDHHPVLAIQPRNIVIVPLDREGVR